MNCKRAKHSILKKNIWDVKSNVKFVLYRPTIGLRGRAFQGVYHARILKYLNFMHQYTKKCLYTQGLEKTDEPVSYTHLHQSELPVSLQPVWNKWNTIMKIKTRLLGELKRSTIYAYEASNHLKKKSWFVTNKCNKHANNF